MLYFDYQSSTPLDPDVSLAMQQCSHDHIGNPHSSHLIGQKSSQLVSNALNHIANLIGAYAENIIFTSGATEANNHALFGCLASKVLKNKIILVSDIEHASVLNAAKFYGELFGCRVLNIPVTHSGEIDLNAYKNLLKEDIGMVSIMHTNNEIGVVQNIKLLAQLAHEAGAIFHTDAAQAFVSSKIDIEDLGVDLLSMSAHKMYGPQGIGALYVSERIRNIFQPFIHGGSQQNGLRSGTAPVALVYGFSVAAEKLKSNFSADLAYLNHLTQLFLKELDEYKIMYKVNGSLTNRHAGNLNICFQGIEADSLLMQLLPFLSASTGSACNSGFIETSHVLKAIGLSDNEAKSSIRFGFGRFTTEDELLQLTRMLKDKIHNLQQVACSA